MVTILASVRGPVVRVALIEAGKLSEYTLWRPEAPDGVGDLHAGRVSARMPALGGVFVALDGEAGFLPDSAGGRGTSEGDMITVRVSRAAQGGKGPRLARVEVEDGTQPGQAWSGLARPGLARPGLIRRGDGPLLELTARYPDAEILADDYALIASLKGRASIAYRPETFDAALEDEIAALAEPNCAFPGGACATFTPTPALIAIDIDGGAASAERDGKARAQARLNHELIPELGRQIRLRNLGGAILIDFAGMKPSARASLGPALGAALARDPLRPRLLGFTGLGFAEILRPRIRPPLHEILRHETS